MHHPVYKPEELRVDVVHLEPKTVSDKLTYGMVRFARWGFDIVSGYKHASPEAARAAAKKEGKENAVRPSPLDDASQNALTNSFFNSLSPNSSRTAILCRRRLGWLASSSWRA
jgi:hypothetical protein